MTTAHRREIGAGAERLVTRAGDRDRADVLAYLQHGGDVLHLEVQVA